MELNKMEKDISKQMNEREIQPSAAAWDRLDAMLSVAEEKKAKPSFGWMRIAAAVLVFVSVGAFFYNHQQGAKNTAIEVATQDTLDTAKPKTNTVKDKIEAIAPVQNQAVAETTDTKSAVQKETVTRNIPSSNASRKIKETTINQINPGVQSTQQAVAVGTPKKEEVIIASPKVTVQDPDQAVAHNQAASKTKVKVDAGSLLSEVDGELELTFREKVFKTVGKNYKEVKVAIANRNYN